MIISIFGAGRSSFYAIDYLVKLSNKESWTVNIYDRTPKEVPNSILNISEVNKMDLNDSKTETIVANSNIVVSLLPAQLHIILARLCLKGNTHLATASFISTEINDLHKEASSKGLIFLNECGLDPGIDHMSTCQVIDELQESGATILGIESYCGGLIAEENCQTTPWKYKFAWSPRNVILAGQGITSILIRNGKARLVQWHQLFKTVNHLDLGELGRFDAYPNRNSVIYRELYHVPHVQTLIRGTLRRNGYCEAWQQLIEWGFTDNLTMLTSIKSVAQFARMMSGFDFSLNHWKKKLSKACIEKIEFLAFDRQEAFTINQGTPADFLFEILVSKWALEDEDKDEVILYHGISYKANSEIHKKTSILQVHGKNKFDTAMAKLVGLPLAMGVELIAKNKIKRKGVQIPNSKEWYEPILLNLQSQGVEIVHSDDQ